MKPKELIEHLEKVTQSTELKLTTDGFTGPHESFEVKAVYEEIGKAITHIVLKRVA